MTRSYRIVFPQKGMLGDDDFKRIADLLIRQAPRQEVELAAAEVRAGLNPHPAGQQQLNIPNEDGEIFEGIQHKYRETVLFFPSQGQTCHAYCTFCFRWAQFVGEKELKIASKDAVGLHRYLAAHPEVSDLLFTGGDPMIMKTRVLEGYLRPFINDPALAHVQTIRIGTKSLTFWPHRFVYDEDADDLLRLLEEVVRSGRHVAIMAHLNHGQELQTAWFARRSAASATPARSFAARRRCSPTSTTIPMSGRGCGASRFASASSPTTCSWSGIPAPDSISKYRSCAAGRSSGAPSSRCRGWAAPSAARA